MYTVKAIIDLQAVLESLKNNILLLIFIYTIFSNCTIKYQIIYIFSFRIIMRTPLAFPHCICVIDEMFWIIYLQIRFAVLSQTKTEENLYWVLKKETCNFFHPSSRQRGIPASDNPLEMETPELNLQSGFPRHYGCVPHFSLQTDRKTLFETIL